MRPTIFLNRSLLLLLALLPLSLSALWGQPAINLVFVEDSTGAPGTYADAHLVQRGETLYGISRQYDLSVEDLKRLNSLKNNTIHPGQRLIVRVAPAPAATAERQPDRGQPVPAPAEELTPPQEEEPYPQAETPSYVQRRQLSEDALEMVPEFSGDTYVERRRYYEVKPGEDIYSISERFGVLVEELREWNALIDVEPGNTIVVGKEYLPGQAQSPAPAYTPAPVPAREVPERVAPSQDRGLTREAAPAPLPAPTPAPAPELARLAPQRPATIQAHAAAYLDRATEAERAYLLGNFMEAGRYARVEHPGAGDRRFYAVHKTLEPGTRVRMAIPGNPGFVEMEVVARLAASSEVMVGLSPACIQILEGAGAPATVTLYHD